PRPVWAVAASVAACVVVAFAMPAIRSISLARHARESVSRLLPAPPPSPHVQPPKISLPPPTLIRPAPVLPAPPKLEMQTSALLEAFWTAHQLDACTEEQIEIQTRGSTVWIKGVASSPGRRRVLEDALRASGTGVQIEIRLPGSAAPPPLGNRIQVIERKMQPSAIPIQAELAAYLHDPAGEAVRSFAHSVVTASEKSAVHAWALRQLATAFPEPVAGRLNPSERLRLQSMLTAHLAALGDSQDELREKLYPLLGTSSQVVGQADTGSWQSSVLAVCASAEASHRRVYRLFTIGSKDEEPIGESREALAAALGAGISARKAAVRWASDIGSPTTAGNLNP
ncbi:MAG: hypothetical protein M1541_16740, partial [Acidobacteria bacterium]|nr:hypothetical protein [Acidobacteriota bacterium]